MSLSQRCDDIVRLIDEALKATGHQPAVGSDPAAVLELAAEEALGRRDRSADVAA